MPLPPVTADGSKYTKAIYGNARARKKYFATVKDSDVKNTVLDVLRAICGILVNANRKQNYHLAVYRTAKALAELRDEFGEAKDFDDLDKVLRYVLDQPGWPFVPLPKDLQESVRRIQQMLRDNHPTNVEDLSCLPDKQPTSKPKSKQPSKKRRR